MTSKMLIIRNRTAVIADDGWIHIVPRGELPNREAGITQVLDGVALETILANIDKDKTRLGKNWPGIYAGEEHFIYNDEKSSQAFAWFKEFEKRDNGIWAKADGLTDIGREAIENKRFKFTSFVADRRDMQKLDGNRARILKIDTVGFTNQANGKEMLTPITNRSEQFRQPADAGPADNRNQQPRKQMKSVCSALGLSADASEENVLAEVNKVLNRATTAEGLVGPLKIEVTTLKTENGLLLDDQIAADLDSHGLKDEKVRNRLTPLLKGMKNRDDRTEFLTMVGKPDATPGNGQRKLFNRDAKAPEGTDAGVATEAARVQKAEAEINDYKIKNRCSYSDARRIIRSSKPELFTSATGE